MGNLYDILLFFLALLVGYWLLSLTRGSWNRKAGEARKREKRRSRYRSAERSEPDGSADDRGREERAAPSRNKEIIASSAGHCGTREPPTSAKREKRTTTGACGAVRRARPEESGGKGEERSRATTESPRQEAAIVEQSVEPRGTRGDNAACQR